MCDIFHPLGAVSDAAKCEEMKLIPVLILFRDCPLVIQPRVIFSSLQLRTGVNLLSED